MDHLARVRIYTDGSYHPPSGRGAWAAVIIEDGVRSELTGTATDTSQHRMELHAVVASLAALQPRLPPGVPVDVMTDSQYVSELPGRRPKLEERNLSTRQGHPIAHADLVRGLYDAMDARPVTLLKVEAHPKKLPDDPNLHRYVDALARRLVREAVR